MQLQQNILNSAQDKLDLLRVSGTRIVSVDLLGGSGLVKRDLISWVVSIYVLHSNWREERGEGVGSCGWAEVTRSRRGGTVKEPVRRKGDGVVG
jgi:hypothetical protein